MVTIQDLVVPCVDLVLDDLAHRAFMHGRELIRVTTALADVGIIDPRWHTAESRARGHAVHAALQAYGQGASLETLTDAMDLAALPYWVGVLRFLEERGGTWVSELAVCDEPMGYAGQGDLLGRVPELGDGAWDLIDLKTGATPSWVGLQTALYARPLRQYGPIRRWALEVPGNGAYRLIPLNLTPDRRRIDRALDKGHEAVALGAVAVARWKRGL